MATIVYSLSGEGRGHATRVRTMVEALRRDHRVVVFAPGDAFDFLAPIYHGTSVSLRQMPGLRFSYDRSGRVSSLGTAAASITWGIRMPRLVRAMARELAELQPDLAIVDFEPVLPRAAHRVGVPIVSLDHQHFLLCSDVSFLPGRLRRHAALMGLVVRAYCPRPAHRVVSSFIKLPLRSGVRRATPVGPLLRPAVLAATPAAGGHLVAYLRRQTAPAVVDALAGCGRPVQIYGLGDLPARGRARFRPIDESGFIADLARAAALVTTAGNQIVGEALFLGKPVLALPEEGNQEQAINAALLATTGAGEQAQLRSLTASRLGAFLERVPELARRIPAAAIRGNEDALRILGRYLPGGITQTPACDRRRHPALAPVLAPGNP